MITKKSVSILLITSVVLGSCQGQEDSQKNHSQHKNQEDFLISDEDNLLPLRKNQRPQIILIPSIKT